MGTSSTDPVIIRDVPNSATVVGIQDAFYRKCLVNLSEGGR